MNDKVLDSDVDWIISDQQETVNKVLLKRRIKALAMENYGSGRKDALEKAAMNMVWSGDKDYIEAELAKLGDTSSY